MTITTLLLDVTAGAGGFNLVAACTWLAIASGVFVGAAEYIVAKV